MQTLLSSTSQVVNSHFQRESNAIISLHLLTGSVRLSQLVQNKVSHLPTQLLETWVHHYIPVMVQLGFTVYVRSLGEKKDTNLAEIFLAKEENCQGTAFLGTQEKKKC